MAGIFKTVRISTQRFIKLKCDEIGIAYLDWDDNADLTKVPEGNLAGLHGFAATTRGKFHDFSFGITCQTMNDPNLFEITNIVDQFYSAMLPEETFHIVDPDTGVVIGTASFIEGTAVHPMNRVENRVTVSAQGSFVVSITE